MEVSKKDKRICRELIHRALEKECERFVKSIQRLASKPIPLAVLNEPYREDNGRSVEGPWHKIYIQIYKRVRNYDRHVAHRYNKCYGSHQLNVIKELYLDKLVTDEDLKRFDQPLRDHFNEWIKLCKLYGEIDDD